MLHPVKVINLVTNPISIKMKVYKESDCASPCNEALREFQVIDIFYQQTSTVLLTHSLFSTSILPVVI